MIIGISPSVARSLRDELDGMKSVLFDLQETIKPINRRISEIENELLHIDDNISWPEEWALTPVCKIIASSLAKHEFCTTDSLLAKIELFNGYQSNNTKKLLHTHISRLRKRIKVTGGEITNSPWSGYSLDAVSRKRLMGVA